MRAPFPPARDGATTHRKDLRMPTFPTPPLLPHPLQELPQPGSHLADEALLHLLHGHLRPLEAIVMALNSALEHEALTYKVTGPLLDLVWQDLNTLVDLLDAWREHQPLPEVTLPTRL